jgi:hypothetical protein
MAERRRQDGHGEHHENDDAAEQACGSTVALAVPCDTLIQSRAGAIRSGRRPEGLVFQAKDSCSA